MANITIESSTLNNTNITCTSPLFWSQAAVNSRTPRLYVCIIAAIAHSVFWLQFVLYSSIRKKSMQWIYAYLMTDMLLLIRFFFLYIIGRTSTECEPSRFWLLFMCIIQATTDNYLNMVEVYILLALNVCRYIQIAYNRDVYQIYPKQLFLAHLGVYLIPLLFLSIQFPLHWAILVESNDQSCDVRYTNSYVQILNLVFELVIPITMNILVIYASVRHVRLTSTLRRAQHHVSAREKYHRSLVIQFLLFYTIWIVSWSPNVIIYQVTNSITDVANIVRLINFCEIALDPFIIAALDVRLWNTWKTIWTNVKCFKCCNRHNQGRIQPA